MKLLSERDYKYKGNATDFYIASGAVAEVVNLAIRLQRPLLVEGEPGCGKTTLADSVARELRLKLVKVSVKSTSRAQDLLYRVNALGRLRDAQIPHHPTASFVYPYITLEPLGKAIQNAERTVVLIDEIDKADIDFPNDLLEVLDDFSFQIDDLPHDEEDKCMTERKFGREVKGSGARPIVIVTSNREKRLPEPFLRRCLYLRLDFPDDVATLREIVQKNLRKSGEQVEREIQDWLDAAIQAFRQVREKAIENRMQKPPTTGELIDWVRILRWEGTSASTLKKKGGFPPRWEMLFKTMDDLKDFDRLARAAGATKDG
jgi:MoxR-like ATPase